MRSRGSQRRAESLGTIYYHFPPVRIFHTFLPIFSAIFFSFLKFPLNLQAGWGLWLEKFTPEACLYLHGVPLSLQRGKTKSSILKQVGRTILDAGDGIIFAVPRIPSILKAETLQGILRRLQTNV